MNRDEQGFLDTEKQQPPLRLIYIDIFLFGLTEKKN